MHTKRSYKGAKLSYDRFSRVIDDGHNSDTPNQMDCIPVPKLGARRGVERYEIVSPLHCYRLVAWVLQSHFWFERRIILSQVRVEPGEQTTPSTHDAGGGKLGKSKRYMLSGYFLARDEEVGIFPSQSVVPPRLQKLRFCTGTVRLDTTRESSRLTFRAKVLSFIAVKRPSYDPHANER